MAEDSTQSPLLSQSQSRSRSWSLLRLQLLLLPQTELQRLSCLDRPPDLRLVPAVRQPQRAPEQRGPGEDVQPLPAGELERGQGVDLATQVHLGGGESSGTGGEVGALQHFFSMVCTMVGRREGVTR